MERAGTAPKRLQMLDYAYRKVVQDALCTWPHEACGALLGPEEGLKCSQRGSSSGSQVPSIVLDAQPAAGVDTERSLDSFRIGAQDMVALQARAQEMGMVIVGFYHSHPNAGAIPSRTDLPQVTAQTTVRFGATWPGHPLVIVSLSNGDCTAVEAYWLTEGEHTRYEPLEVVRIPPPIHPCQTQRPERTIKAE